MIVLTLSSTAKVLKILEGEPPATVAPYSTKGRHFRTYGFFPLLRIMRPFRKFLKI